MAKYLLYLFFLLICSSCVFYAPLKEREREQGWIHLESRDTEFKASGGVSFHNQVRATWAVRQDSEGARYQRIEREQQKQYQDQGWKIYDQELFRLLVYGKLTLSGPKAHWLLLYRKHYSELEIKLR